MNILLIGPPGSGKGTQSKFIVSKYNLLYVSVGDILRNFSYKENELSKKIKISMSKGELIDDYIIINIIKDYIYNNNKNKNGILMDGFPRNIEQAYLLENLEIKFNIVIEFFILDSILIERLLGRMIHIKSGRIYHNIFNPPLISGLDDISGEKLDIRNDDNIDIIKQRLKLYNCNLKNLKKYFYEKSIKNELIYNLINVNIKLNLLKNFIFKILDNYIKKSNLYFVN